jgi:hypothetical protein
MKELNSMFKDRQAFTRSGERIGILIYSDNASVRRSRQNGIRVPARSDRAIDKRAAALRPKPLDNLFE